MITVQFVPETACLLLEDGNNKENYLDYQFINKFKFENGMMEREELSNEINDLLFRNSLTESDEYSINPMLKKHLESMIQEYREIGKFSRSKVAILLAISDYTNDEQWEEINKFYNMFESISNHAGMPIKYLLEGLK